MQTPLLEKIVYGMLLALLVLTPLPYGSVETWSIALWEVLVFATVVLWALLTVVEGKLKIHLNPLVWPMLALLILAVVQIWPFASAANGERQTISFSPFVTYQFAVKLFASICFFLLFATFINNDQRRMMAVKVIVAVCSVIAIVGIGQAYIGRLLWQRGAFGPFVNRNHFAGFLVMGVALAGGLMIGRVVKQIWLAIYASCALAMCAGIGLSASRGGVLALAAEIVFLVLIAIPTFFHSRREDKARRVGVLIRAAAVLLIGTGAIAGAMLLVGSEGLVANFSQLQAETGGELPASERFSRRDIWRATTELIKDHPMTGVGLGAFQFAYTRYDQSSGIQRVEQSHNDYLQIVADAGLIGGAIALVFIVLLFVRGFTTLQTHNRQKRAVAMGALAGCFAIAVHSFVEFNLQITSNAQLFLALAALATTGRHKHRESEDE
ncbi:MAG: O-antigen ligase family protein [Acidobacteriota bacterium]|nr:O-antigen ligase family protein [Acidobacteriota bacterium]